MKDKMHTGELYLPTDEEIAKEQQLCLEKLYDYNATRPSEAKKREKERLTDIANNFLDNENVSNEDIREAYIDWYVDKMSNETDFAGEYVDNRIYTMLTDVWYVFAKIIDDWSIIREIEEQTSQEEIDRLDEEFEEYKNYIDSEEYEEDMIDGLEDL